MAAARSLKTTLIKLLRPYFRRLPLEVRWLWYDIVPYILSRLGRKSSSYVGTLRGLSLRKYRILELVRQIIENGSLFLYADLWATSGFAITPNYWLTRSKGRSTITFAEKPIPQQVSEFRLQETPPQYPTAFSLGL